MEAKIYLAQGTEKLGPFSRQEVERRLLDGEISGSTLAWQAGMADWLPVTTVLDGMGPSLDSSAYSHFDEPAKAPGVGRAIYFFGCLAANIVTGVGSEAIKSVGGSPTTIAVGAIVSALISVGACLTLGFHRLKNIGYNPWLTFIMLIPCIGLIIGIPCLLAPAGYAKTQKLDLTAKIIAGVLLGLVALGVLAVIIGAALSAK